MNKLILIFVAFTLICCNTKQVKIEDFDFKPLIKKDMSKISELIDELDTIKKVSDWVDGDRQFYRLWLEGAKSELKSDFNSAIKCYKDASEVSRYEISSYEVKLPLGRALIQNGNIAEANTILKKFKEEALNDINNTDAEWELSEEGKSNIRNQIEICDKLLLLINK